MLPAWLAVLEAPPPVNETLTLLNFVTNAGAFGLLTVIVIWLGPKVFRDWTAAHKEVGDKIDETISRLIEDAQQRQERSQANIMAFVQREKESFDKREERMYAAIDKSSQATVAALIGLKEAIAALTHTQRGKST